MDVFNIMLSVMGGLLLLLGLTSGLVKNRTVLSEPLIALLVGIVVGPAVLELLNLAHWGNTHTILEQAARLTMAVAVMGVALRLPHGALRRNWKSLALLLGVMMPLIWVGVSLRAAAHPDAATPARPCALALADPHVAVGSARRSGHGVAALFYATLSVRKAGTDIVWVVGSMVIAASVLVHGVTATPFTQWYGALQHQSVPERHKASQHEHAVRSR